MMCVAFNMEFRSVYKELHADHGNGLLTTRRRYGSGGGHNAVLRWVFQKGLPLGAQLCEAKCSVLYRSFSVAVKMLLSQRAGKGI